ncbi:MAG: hypothetical protein ACFFCQ_14000 [Promethearchaeota archaeon]
MVFHGPSLHFHLGAWAVSAVCTFFAFWLSFSSRSGLLQEKYVSKETVKRYVDQLDFTAHICGIVGFLGLVVTGFAGWIDASGLEMWESLSIEGVTKGYEASTEDEFLAFKVIWSIVGMYCFLFSGFLRVYFVTLRKERIYDQHFAVQILYGESTLFGFFTMVAVAAAGGIYVYGESFIQDVPFMNEVLPGADNFLILITVLSVLLAGTLILSSIFMKPERQKTA